jgi:tRNA 2-thiocytidine biosynthesis protein TtcA
VLPEARAAGPPEDRERLARKLSGTMLRTVATHRLIEEGGRILVAISGGKDSYTLLLNLFYSGRLQAMPAGYTTNDRRFRVIRPLIECSESDIATHASGAGYPILPCNLCGSQNDLKRRSVARLLASLERTIPDLRQVMLAALKNVRPSHLLDPEVAEAWESRGGDYPPRH